MAKIIIVDDEPDVLRVVSVVLDMDGHESEMIRDSVHALQRLLTSDCDLAIIDLMMPSMNGEELLEKVKTARPDLPVILLSGTGDMFDIPRLMEMGAHAYVEKPFEPATLLDHVRTALRP